MRWLQCVMAILPCQPSFKTSLCLVLRASVVHFGAAGSKLSQGERVATLEQPRWSQRCCKQYVSHLILHLHDPSGKSVNTE